MNPSPGHGEGWGEGRSACHPSPGLSPHGERSFQKRMSPPLALMPHRQHQHQLERCPACGQRVESSEARQCGLCGYEFVDNRATNADVTPYADAYAHSEPGFWRMIRWTWGARLERIKHLGLMRTSAASTRFAWVAILWLSFALAIYEGTRVGWYWVSGGAAQSKPTGAGWVHAASVARPAAASQSAERAVDLWWNPAEGLIAGAIGFLAGIIVSWLLLWSLRLGTSFAHSAGYRHEGRMSAAIMYSYGFFVPAAFFAIIMALRPFAYVGAMSGWRAYPPPEALHFLAGMVIGIPAVWWWLWMIRLGASSPKTARGRAGGFMILGAPLLLVGAALGFHFGLERLERALFFAMNLQF